MFKNYLTIAYRKLVKSKLYTLVNTLSLVIGLTSCILIGLYIRYETSFDRFHEKGDRIVRVTMDFGIGETKNQVAVTGTKVGPQFARTFPTVENFVRTYKTSQVVKYEENLFEEDDFLYVDSSFFSIFSFPLKNGNPTTALNSPDKIVITESAAEKYFGKEDPIGKIIQVGIDQNFQISGMAVDAPAHSQIQFDFIVPFSSLSKGEEWFSANYVTYLLVQDQQQMNPWQQQVSDYMKEVSQNELQIGEGNYLTYHLEPLKRVYLYSSLNGFEPNGNITHLYIISTIALLILLIACINYTNLATAQASNRTGEIGIRKALGAQKSQLFGQLLGESAFLTVISLVLAVILSLQLLPFCNQLAGTRITPDLFWQPLPLLALVLLCVLISFASGAYPAFILSNFKLVDILKSKIRLSSSGGLGRRSLIVFQFAISIFLIIATLIIGQQLNFIQQKDLGYDKEHILVLPVDRTLRKQYDAIKEAIARHPEVISVSGAHETPTFIEWGDGITVNEEGEEKQLSVNALPVDLDFTKMIGIEILEGTNFTPADEQKLDTSNNYQNYHYTFILNEAAVKALGWTPEEAIGKTIRKNHSGTVKAVVRDFHFSSLHQPIGPLVIFLNKGFVNELFVKVTGENIQPTLQSLQSLWKERVPHRPFEYHFLDTEYDTMYRAEQRIGKMFGTFAVVAILLACLGLFALAAFTTVQRTKEIGIRKVLGASVASITALLSSEFVKLVLVALVIAIPIAWFSIEQWLQDFAYRISVHGWVFALAGVITILVALLAVSFQTIKAALANPVESLRNE
jgi:putative ABC transport system permease protein